MRELKFEQLRCWPVADLARCLGLSERRGRDQGRPSFSCPSCGAESRHRNKLKHGAIYITPDGSGWRCYQCDAKGGSPELAAACILGITRPERDGWSRVLREVRGLFEVNPLTFARACGNRTPDQVEEPKYPHPTEVIALHSACIPVVQDDEVRAWLDHRHLTPEAVADFDLARALPPEVPVPSWAHLGGRSWRTVGFRLLVPLFGVAGRLASVRARAVRLSANQPKSVTPTGYATRGLFMADALARAALAGTVLGDGTPAAEALRQRGLVITEGEPDFLTWATRWSDANEDAPAVIGVSAGSWTAELAERIPQGCSVAVRTHTDAAGDAYANAIIRSISSKCPCFRLVPEVSHA